MSIALAAVAALSGLQAENGSSAQASPLALTVPDIGSDTRPLGDERKFFVFHRADTSVEQARADLSFCFRYIDSGGGIVMPYFFPWVGPGTGNKVEYSGGNYGLVGAMIGAMIAAGLERSKRQLNLMRCMLPRGYARYRISEELWKELNGADRSQSIEVQARIASGPTPPTPKALP